MTIKSNYLFNLFVYTIGFISTSVFMVFSGLQNLLAFPIVVLSFIIFSLLIVNKANTFIIKEKVITIKNPLKLGNRNINIDLEAIDNVEIYNIVARYSNERIVINLKNGYSKRFNYMNIDIELLKQFSEILKQKNVTVNLTHIDRGLM